MLPYLSSDVAKRFQPALLEHGAPVTCPCELHGGTADNLGIGVVLDFVQVYALAEARGRRPHRMNRRPAAGLPDSRAGVLY